MALVIDDTLISNVADNLKAAMTTDPNMRKAIQEHIREALWEARKEMINSVSLCVPSVTPSMTKYLVDKLTSRGQEKTTEAAVPTHHHEH